MKVQDVVNEIIGNRRYIAHFVDIYKTRAGVTSVTVEYWNQIGNTNTCVGYCKKMIVLNYGKENEICFFDKATPSMVVRTRGWF